MVYVCAFVEIKCICKSPLTPLNILENCLNLIVAKGACSLYYECALWLDVQSEASLVRAPSVRSIPSIVKVYGAHLKASAAMVRLRLYDVLALLPPETFEGPCRSHYSVLTARVALAITITVPAQNYVGSLYVQE